MLVPPSSITDTVLQDLSTASGINAAKQREHHQTKKIKDLRVPKKRDLKKVK